MLRAFLAKTVLGSAAPSSTPTVDVGRHRARMESARGPTTWCQFLIERPTWTLQRRRPRPRLAQRLRWGGLLPRS